MSENKGMLSIESSNIFSILKKWLYTEQDIVFRELISNAADAIEKLSLIKKEAAEAELVGGLDATGADDELATAPGRITVHLDKAASQLIISDNGIGMTAEELHKYINHIAFSGAEEFIKQNSQAGDSIIGHFGVGFYSSFMLADHVAIETKSYQADAPAVRWDCTADMAYEMGTGAKDTVGTDIILYLNPDSPYFKEPSQVYDIIRKYFIFSRTAIYLEAEGYDNVLVNMPDPEWRRPAGLIRGEEMNQFYQEFFDDPLDPLFYLPFESLDIGVRGVLFFRNTRQGTEELDGVIKVYSRGVYIGENIPELIPKFVNLQHGIIECDDLPLVVSRSSIRDDNQKDDMVQLVYECLTQEVTIHLNDMFQNRRQTYEELWPELSGFVKYGVMKDKIFSSVMAKKVIFQDLYGQYRTIQEYASDGENGQPDAVYYASDALDQAHYIEIFKKCQLNALLFDHVIDQPLLYRYEIMFQSLRFTRIDSNIESLFPDCADREDPAMLETLTSKITKALGERLGAMTLRFVRLEHTGISTLIVNDEQSRRMADMMEIYGFLNKVEPGEKQKQTKSILLLNLNNEIIQFISASTDESAIAIAVNQLLDLSLMSQQALNPEDIEPFINRSEAILTASLKRLF